jgi:sialic acid synthase SpsE
MSIKIKISKNYIGEKYKTYFIADIAANHDGNLKRAKKLIKLCALAGANAAKFQHFKAETIVSRYDFDNHKKKAHQKKWKKSVFDVYRNASINFSWTKVLKIECNKYNIDFLTSPYDLNYVDMVNQYISAFKIGSGDITWFEILKKIANKKKPVLLATGASTLMEVKKAVKEIKKYNKNLILMQCNTNYTANEDNFNYVNLNVLDQYKRIFGKNIILGLSDHTQGYSTVLGAIAKGARVIEKHFTDDNNREGPDHKFSMNPKNWKEMIKESRRLEAALGDGIKKIEKNETESCIVQRRSIKAKTYLKKNHILSKNDLIALRPCSENDISPGNLNELIGKKIKININKSESITWKKIY